MEIKRRNLTPLLFIAVLTIIVAYFALGGGKTREDKILAYSDFLAMLSAKNHPLGTVFQGY